MRMFQFNVNISVIIPAYNEANRIEKTLRAVSGYLAHQSYDSEILVVNDGSRDATRDIVTRLQKEIKNLIVEDNKQNHGKGFVVRQGMLKAKGETALFMDADNSTSIDHIARMLPHLQQNFDVVIGSRRIEGAHIAIRQPLMRDLLGGVFRTIVQIIVPLGVKDSQAGFKLFSRKAIDIIFHRQTLSGWAFDVEILAIARKHNLNIKEIPITWYNDTQSRMTLGGMFKTLGEFLKIRWNVIRNKY